MLQAVRHRIPVVLDPGPGVSDLAVEDSLPVEQVLDPNIVLVNTHPTVDATLDIVRRVDLGVSSVPEDDGVFETTVVSSVTVSAGGGEVTYTPEFMLQMGTEAPTVKHLITISHADGSETVIVQAFITGMSDLSTREKILNFTRATVP